MNVDALHTKVKLNSFVVSDEDHILFRVKKTVVLVDALMMVPEYHFES